MINLLQNLGLFNFFHWSYFYYSDIEFGTCRYLKMADDHENQPPSNLGQQEKALVPQSKPLKKFTRFPDLPVELRLKIWNLSFSAPRHVNFIGGCTFDPGRIENWDQWRPEQQHLYQLKAARKQFPHCLFVNRESQDEMLRRYTFVFQRGRLKSLHFCRDPIPLWTNTRVDTACIE